MGHELAKVFAQLRVALIVIALVGGCGILLVLKSAIMAGAFVVILAALAFVVPLVIRAEKGLAGAHPDQIITDDPHPWPPEDRKP